MKLIIHREKERGKHSPITTKVYQIGIEYKEKKRVKRMYLKFLI